MQHFWAVSFPYCLDNHLCAGPVPSVSCSLLLGVQYCYDLCEPRNVHCSTRLLPPTKNQSEDTTSQWQSRGPSESKGQKKSWSHCKDWREEDTGGPLFDTSLALPLPQWHHSTLATSSSLINWSSPSSKHACNSLKNAPKLLFSIMFIRYLKLGCDF